MAIQLKKTKAFDSLNLTPLIDVVMFLLIFFMIATRFAQEDRELPVKLPSASSAVPMTMEPSELVVNVDATGKYMVQGQILTIGQLEKTIQQAVIDNPVNQNVTIRGDRQVAFQSVVSVIDLCTRLKVPSYKITTEAEEQR